MYRISKGWVEYDEAGGEYLRQALADFEGDGTETTLAERIAEPDGPVLAAAPGCQRITLDAFEFDTLWNAVDARAERERRIAGADHNEGGKECD